MGKLQFDFIFIQASSEIDRSHHIDRRDFLPEVETLRQSHDLSIAKRMGCNVKIDTIGINTSWSSLSFIMLAIVKREWTLYWIWKI